MPGRWLLVPFFILLGAATVFLLPYISYLRRPSVEDGRTYGRVPIHASDTSVNIPYDLKPLPTISSLPKDLKLGEYRSLEEVMEANGTLAILVMKRDSIIYENYFNGFICDSITQLFSATKPMVVSLLTLAIEEGFIESIDQKVADFLPEFNTGEYAAITLRHLSQMRSGFDYDEYRKILGTLKFYYQRNLASFMKDPKNLKLRFAPGEKFTYKSIDTQVLGACIEKATGMSLNEFFYHKIWKYIGAEYPAYWSLGDPSTGMLKFYGGLNVSVKDLARLGMMYLHDGKYMGRQLLPLSWVNHCDDLNNRNGKYTYCMGWWYDLNDRQNNIYFGAGFGGQIMFINETTETLIIRLGTKKGGIPWYRLFKEISTRN